MHKQISEVDFYEYQPGYLISHTYTHRVTDVSNVTGISRTAQLFTVMPEFNSD
jgi:hypothetical protein